MYINEEEWSFEKGTTITKIELDFDPLKYKTKAGAAKAFYKLPWQKTPSIFHK